VPWQIVEFMQINTLVTMYNNHLATYNIGKKHFIQFIPNVMWKCVYQVYFNVCPKVPFVKETLKDHLWETLKELKTNNSNEGGSDQATLQYNDVLD